MQPVGQLARWGLKSGAALTANLALLTVWVDYAGIDPRLAVFINIPVITSVAYVVTDRWVFDEYASPQSLRGHVTQYAKMQSVNLTGKAGNYVLYVLLIPVVDYRVAWVVGAIAMFLLTFTGNREAWRRLAPA